MLTVLRKSKAGNTATSTARTKGLACQVPKYQGQQLGRNHAKISNQRLRDPT